MDSKFVLPTSGPYALLALFLSPSLCSEKTDALREASKGREIDWTGLLCQANLHFCTPAWYARLRQHGLIRELPEELQEYLHQLYQANLERNDALRLELLQLLSVFEGMGAEVVVLKGAATFFDGLYGDPGARMMGDIDLLVEHPYAEEVQRVLLRSGYVATPTKKSSTYSPEHLSQHLPRLLKPNTPVALEIHFRVEKGQGGRALPPHLAWSGRQILTSEGMSVSVLCPTLRLLHNTIHALVPHREFIRSQISLQQLAEFSALACRYGDKVDWLKWFERGVGQGLGREFAAYLTLGNRLMGVPWPEGMPRCAYAQRDAGRIVMACNLGGVWRGHPANIVQHARRQLAGFAIRVFYHLHRPSWVWRNVCYVENNISLSIRIMLRKIAEALWYRLLGRPR